MRAFVVGVLLTRVAARRLQYQQYLHPPSSPLARLASFLSVPQDDPSQWQEDDHQSPRSDETTTRSGEDVDDRDLPGFGLNSAIAETASDPDACACRRCSVQRRQPHELSVVANVSIKCAPSDVSPQNYAGQEDCYWRGTEGGESASVLSLGRGETVDLLRFCFSECKPVEGLTSPLNSGCAKADGEDVAKLAGETDLAFLWASSGASGGAKGSTVGGGDDAAPKKPVKGEALAAVADARQKVVADGDTSDTVAAAHAVADGTHGLASEVSKSAAESAKTGIVSKLF